MRRGPGTRTDPSFGNGAATLGPCRSDFNRVPSACGGREKAGVPRRADSPAGGLVLLDLAGREELDLEPLDARAVDLDHLEAEAVIGDLVASLGGSSELPEDEACNRVVVLLWQLLLELLVEVVDRERAVDAQAPVLEPFQRLVREVVLVLDLADDLLEQVLERDDALEGPVLVDDEGHVLVRAPELGQHGGEVLRLGHDVAVAHKLLDLNVLDAPVVEGREEVADVEDADDVVERAPVDRVARVGGVDHRREGLLRRQVDREGDDLGARDHDLVDLLVREVEDLVDHLLLARLDLARVLGGGDDVTYVLLRVRDYAGRGGLDPEETREGVRGGLEEQDDRVGDDVHSLDRECNPQGRGLVLREGDGLRDQLAERHVQVGDEGEGEHESYAVREGLVDPPLDDRLAHGTEGDREGGDSELHRPDEAKRAVHDAESDASAQASLVVELDETAAAGGHERGLGRYEEGVPQHEQENGDDLEEDVHAPVTGALVLGGSSSKTRPEDSARLRASLRRPRSGAARSSARERRGRPDGRALCGRGLPGRGAARERGSPSWRPRRARSGPCGRRARLRSGPHREASRRSDVPARRRGRSSARCARARRPERSAPPCAGAGGDRPRSGRGRPGGRGGASGSGRSSGPGRAPSRSTGGWRSARRHSGPQAS